MTLRNEMLDFGLPRAEVEEYLKEEPASPPQPIDIEFLDSHYDMSNWSQYDPDTLQIVGQAVSLRGYLIFEDDRWLVVALAINETGYSVGRMVVPKVAVTLRSPSQ